jgi:hypothetical protein
MELSELAHARLICLAIVLAWIGQWVIRRIDRRRQQARFAALASSFGETVVREGEFLSRFPVIEGRTFEVRYQHISRNRGGSWFLVTETPLAGVSELRSTDIWARAMRPWKVEGLGSDFKKQFRVLDPAGSEWVNEPVRAALVRFYSLGLPLDRLSVEQSRLIHRWRLPLRRIDAARLREVLARQSEVAAAIESAL